MRELTENEQIFFEEMRKDLESKFVIPEFKPFNIEYVDKEENADVKISEYQEITDYLAVGFACIQKNTAVPNDDKIRVYKAPFLSIAEATMLSEANSLPDGGRTMYSNALAEIAFEVDQIMEKCFIQENAILFCTGMLLYITVTAHLMGIQNMFEGQELLEFKSFEDTVEAQKSAFEIAKINIIASLMGVVANSLFDS